MPDLTDRIRVAVEYRLAVARAASGPKGRFSRWDTTFWHSAPEEPLALITQGTPNQPGALGIFTTTPLPGPIAFHIALNDPVDAILDAEWARDVLDRHEAVPSLGAYWCRGCNDAGANISHPSDRDQPPDWPCAEVRALAKRFGVTINDQ